MGFTNIQETVLDLSSGSQSVSHDTNGDANVMVALVAGRKDFTPTITYNGVSLTQRATYAHGYFGRGEGDVTIFADVTNVPTGDNTLALTLSATPNGGKCVFYTLKAGEAPSIAKYDAGGGLNSSFSDSYTSADGNPCIAFAAAQGHSSALDSDYDFGTVTADYGYTTSNSWGFTGYGCLGRSSGGDVDASTQSVSVGLLTSLAAGWVVIEDEPIVAEPSAMTTDVTMPSPTMTVDENIYLTSGTMTLSVTMPTPTLSLSYPRQIPLVGRDVEMPGRIPRPSGLTTPVLSDDGTTPEWIESDDWLTDADVPLDNTTAVTDPTSTDDTSEGYSRLSRWVNTTTDTVWICADATEGAAVWNTAGPGADGEDGNMWLDGSGAPGAGLGTDDDYYLESS